MRSELRAGLCSLILALTAALPLHAQGWIIPRPCGLVPQLIDVRTAVPRDCRPDIVRTRSDVHVELTGRVLHYEVEERFMNRGGGLGEADYVFPLPADAAFQDVQLSIDGRLVAGTTMNAGEARGIYEQIVRARRDPALVEWMGRGLLRARIFPLEPGQEKRVVLRFQRVAPREGDALRVDYAFGANNGTSQALDAGASSFTLSYKESPELGAPYSPTHALEISEQHDTKTVTVRGDARSVTLLVPLHQAATVAISLLPYAPDKDDGFALLTVSPPVATHLQSTPRDITFVLDVSGSMQGRKMEQARAAGRALLGTLRPADRFRLIDFSSDVRDFRDGFLYATPANVRDAEQYLDALDATGGTNIEAALREAVRLPVTTGRLSLVLFVTDGEPTVGDQRPDDLAAIARGSGDPTGEQRRIFTFGLGSDVNASLLEQLAIDGRGTSQFVRPDESVERMVGIVAKRLVDPMLTEVRVRVDGDVKLSRLSPAQPADIFADRDLVVLARYSGHGAATVTVEGTQRGVPVRWTSSVEFPERSRDNPFVARLWAAQRIGFLSAEARRSGGSGELDDEIRSLGEQYGIPTQFTSYLVTEPRLASGAPPADPRASRFEQARLASVQRATRSLAAIDSTAAASPSTSASTRRVEGRLFQLRGAVWTDVRLQSGVTVVSIKPYSRAYFDLVERLPELRSVFALGDRVTVMGRNRAITLADGGETSLTEATLSALVAAW